MNLRERLFTSSRFLQTDWNSFVSFSTSKKLSLALLIWLLFKGIHRIWFCLTNSENVQRHPSQVLFSLSLSLSLSVCSSLIHSEDLTKKFSLLHSSLSFLPLSIQKQQNDECAMFYIQNFWESLDCHKSSHHSSLLLSLFAFLFLFASLFLSLSLSLSQRRRWKTSAFPSWRKRRECEGGDVAMSVSMLWCVVCMSVCSVRDLGDGEEGEDEFRRTHHFAVHNASTTHRPHLHSTQQHISENSLTEKTMRSDRQEDTKR